MYGVIHSMSVEHKPKKISNEEILSLIYKLSGSLSDLNIRLSENSSDIKFIWSKELRNQFNKVVRYLEKEI